jgi:hypothetical protein
LPLTGIYSLFTSHGSLESPADRLQGGCLLTLLNSTLKIEAKLSSQMSAKQLISTRFQQPTSTLKALTRFSLNIHVTDKITFQFSYRNNIMQRQEGMMSWDSPTKIRFIL